MAHPNVEIRIYSRFSEIRSRVQSEAGKLELNFSKQTWSQIREPSLTLLGLPYRSRTVTPQDSWLSSFEGNRVQVRLPSGVEDVTLIRADDLLVQDRNGSYYRAAAEQLLLPDAPPLYGQEGLVHLTFDLPEAGEGLLSYVTQALTWTAQYTLDLAEQGNATLTANASIHNHSLEPYEPNTLLLIAGEVRESRHSYGRPQLFRDIDTSWGEPDDGVEVAGLYRYQLQRPPRIAGRSTITVPFEEVRLRKAELVDTLTPSFQPSRKEQGVFQREIRLQAEGQLLGATVTLRDQGYLVGEQRIEETAPGAELTFRLGRDPGVTYRCESQIISREAAPAPADEDDEDQEKGKEAKAYVRMTVQVRYELHNTTRRMVTFEIRESLPRNSTVSGDARKQAQQACLQGALEPGEQRTLEFEVQFIVEKQ